MSWLSRLLLPPLTFLWHCPTACAKQACVVFTLRVKGKYKVILEEEEGTKQEKCNFSDLLDYSYTRDLSPCLPLWRTQGQKAQLLGLFSSLLCFFNEEITTFSPYLTWVPGSKQRIVDPTLSGEEMKGWMYLTLKWRFESLYPRREYHPLFSWPEFLPSRGSRWQQNHAKCNILVLASQAKDRWLAFFLMLPPLTLLCTSIRESFWRLGQNI